MPQPRPCSSGRSPHIGVDLWDDVVQAWAVVFVRGQRHGRVTDVALHLGQLLQS